MAHSLTRPRQAPRGALDRSITTATPTRRLLACGMLAGPLYLVIGLTQALTRPGFDLTRHELSQLAVGDWGWVQIGNFFVTGLLVIATAVGIRRALRSGPGRTWVPRLVGLYGVGLVGAGMFTADAGLGFPLGTPSDAVTISSHGMLHLASAAVGFCGLIAASLIFGRREVSLGHSLFAAYSIATGVVFLVAFLAGVVLAGAAATHGLATLMLWISVLLGWCWLTSTSARLQGDA